MLLPSLFPSYEVIISFRPLGSRRTTDALDALAFLSTEDATHHLPVDTWRCFFQLRQIFPIIVEHLLEEESEAREPAPETRSVGDAPIDGYEVTTGRIVSFSGSPLSGHEIKVVVSLDIL